MEKSIFEYSAQRIFSISGNITDSFCTADLQILSFEQYLCGYLKNTGYECVVFYSGGGSGLYFRDSESAENYAACIEGRSEAEPEPAAEDEDDIFNVFGIEETKPAAEKKKISAAKDVRMRYPMENDADFIHKAEALMNSSEKRTAIVFTSFDDFVNRTDSVSRRNYNRLFESWKSMPADNRNICIFLSKGLGTKEIQQMLSNNSELSLSSLFISEDHEGHRKFNSDTCLIVGKPGSDELRNMLYYWAVRGCRKDGKTKRAEFEWNEKNISSIVNTLLFYCHESENGLNTLRDRIEIFMRDCEEDRVPFSADTVNRIYEKKDVRYSPEDPEELLESRRESGWENACDIIKRNTDEYETFVKYSTQEKNEKQDGIYTLERFESLADNSINWKIPNFVIQGNPGVGKTEIARLIGRILYKHGILSSGHTVCASRDTLVGQYLGASAINTVNAIERAQGGVLFIDEVYSLVNLGESSSGGENYCAEVINTLVAAMTNPKYHFCVVVAGYKSQMGDFFRMNEGLPSRFSTKNIITIDDYKPETLEKIFRSYISKNRLTLSEDVSSSLGCYFVNLYRERDRKTFGNARDIVALAKSVTGNAQMRAREAQPVIEKCDFEGSEHLFDGFGASTREEAYGELKKYIGMDFLEQMFDDQCNLFDECTDKGIPYPGPEHMIWVGNPGTGKSTAAKLLAQLYYATGILGGRSPVIVDASSLIGTHVGDSQKLINEKMDEASQNNTVLIIEEAYQLSKDKNYGHAALNSMMNRMVDERKNFNVVFIVYSTEYEDFISANAGILSRCTRYDFKDYTPQQLTDIFKKMCSDAKDYYTDEALEKVREHMEKLYASRTDKTGNARAVERFLADMRKRRYPRIKNMKDVPPEVKYRFEKEDVGL